MLYPLANNDSKLPQEVSDCILISLCVPATCATYSTSGTIGTMTPTELETV